MVQKIGYSIKMMMRGEINKMGKNRNFNHNENEVVEEAIIETPVVEAAPVETVVDEPKKEEPKKVEVEVAPVKAVEPKKEKKAEPVKRTATL